MLAVLTDFNQTVILWPRILDFCSNKASATLHHNYLDIINLKAIRDEVIKYFSLPHGELHQDT